MLLQLFDYLDAIFSRLTRVWMYLLEIAGMTFVFLRMQVHDNAAQLALTAKTKPELDQAVAYFKSVNNTTSLLMPYVILLCVIMPAVIATLRTVRKKWILKTAIGEITQEFADGSTTEAK